MEKPKSSTNVDHLGYDVYAETLWARIESALKKDVLNKADIGDDPMVIGLFGEWGAGKSYLLNLMQDQSKAWAKDRIGFHYLDGKAGLTVPVLFQPWKYEHEEHLHVPLMLHIFSELQKYEKKAQSWKDKSSEFGLETWEMIKKNLPQQVGLFEKCLAAAVAATATPPVFATVAGLVVVRKLLSYLKLRKPSAPDPLKSFKYSADGRFFYEMHEALKDVTCPSRENGQLKHHLRAPININFVIFIDDLDRCLPEKAVQTLEMIKTIFNIESFAFVLALDEEVIERGIGHRYQAYNFAGKKPEMPITGFEYLEKIVHLPFRLPALSSVDAANYIKFLETDLLKLNKKFDPPSLGPWFDGWHLNVARSNPSQSSINTPGEGIYGLPASKDGKHNLRGASDVNSSDFHLAYFVLYCFDAYVPRKLVRLVELFYQIERIAIKRKRPLTKALGGETDIRIVMALLMLQLFQPELYRTIKRTGTGFGEILRAFQHVDGLKNPASNMDLLRWSSFGKKGDVPPTTIKSAMLKIGQLTDDPGERHTALQVRLPIVACLIEHRQAHRHAFDPMKLFQILAESIKNIPVQGDDVTEFDAKRYYGLLSRNWDTAESTLGVSSSTRTIEISSPVVQEEKHDRNLEKVEVPKEPSLEKKQSNFVVLHDVDSLFQLMVKKGTSQKAILQTTGLKEGDLIVQNSLNALYASLERWLLSGLIPAKNLDNDAEVLRRKGVLLGNLALLVPYIPSEKQLDLWKLVETSIDPTKPTDPKLRAQWYDVRAALGCDFRFTHKQGYVNREEKPTEHNGNIADALVAPAGFVEIPAGKFKMGSKEDKDNPIRTLEQHQPFYMSRYPVTVAQYATFIDADGYKDQALWEATHKQAWDWQTGEFDSSKVLEGEDSKPFKDWLARRPEPLRHEPMNWAEQKANANRPVTGVTWFEATVYAAWLERQRLEGVKRGEKDVFGTSNMPKVLSKKEQYKLRLPTEGEWERAARAGGAGGAGKFPWGDDEANIDQRANVDRKIGSATTVGSYAPNAFGLYDMAGNVWEWQANLYSNEYKKDVIDANKVLNIGKTWQMGDRPSLRGGSGVNRPGDARCSYRYGDLPDGWDYYFGFRLVLSLADL
jgi:formylglycine-generating enzyme required for sulfatase activity